MSVNWSKYATPQQSKNLAKNPVDNAVLGLHVGKIRRIPLIVNHNPTKNNRAHSLIVGLNTDKRKKVKIRDELALIARWEERFGT